MNFVAALEQACGVQAQYNLLPMQPGDVYRTQANVSALKAATGFKPCTSIQDGINRFAAWYREYYIRQVSEVP